MYTEDAFLAAIQSNPADDFARNVYADWLEEHGDERADFLRLQVQAKGLDRGSLEWREVQLKLTELRKSLSTFWLERVDQVTELRYHFERRYFTYGSTMHVPCWNADLVILILSLARSDSYPSDERLDFLAEIINHLHDLTPALHQAALARLLQFTHQDSPLAIPVNTARVNTLTQLQQIATPDNIGSLISPVVQLSLPEPNLDEAEAYNWFRIETARDENKVCLQAGVRNWKIFDLELV